jgi:uncharacterized protein (TIGR03437 family)
VTRPARLFVVAPTQINYLTPAGMALGPATVNVITAGGATISGTMQVDRVAPGLYSADKRGSGVAAAFYLRVAADGQQTQDLIYDPTSLAATPVDLGAESDGVYLLLFGTGIRNHGGSVTATVGGADVPVLGAVAQGQYPGFDQVNIGPLPRSLGGRGEVDLAVTVDGKRTNVLKVNIR